MITKSNTDTIWTHVSIHTALDSYQGDHTRRKAEHARITMQNRHVSIHRLYLFNSYLELSACTVAKFPTSIPCGSLICKYRVMTWSVWKLHHNSGSRHRCLWNSLSISGYTCMCIPLSWSELHTWRYIFNQVYTLDWPQTRRHFVNMRFRQSRGNVMRIADWVANSRLANKHHH